MSVMSHNLFSGIPFLGVLGLTLVLPLGHNNRKVHNDPSLFCDNCTQYKNKVEHFLLTFALWGVLRQRNAEKKKLHFAFVLGKVVATRRWVTITEGSQ